MVDSKQAFEVILADVSQTQMQGKTDVLLEFHVDDTTGANEVCRHPLTVSAFPSKTSLLFVVIFSTCSSSASWVLTSNYYLP